MRTQDGFYFSPQNTFMSLHFDNKKGLINAFYSRIEGFYIKPAIKLDGTFEAFASGALCVCAIDILARLEYGDNTGVGDRFKKWVRAYLKSDFNDFGNEVKQYHQHVTFDDILYECFRNGLVHEGVIKQGFQFSYETGKKLFYVESEIVVINPKVLLSKVYDSLNVFVKKLKDDDALFEKFSKQLHKDLKKDITDITIEEKE